MPENRVPSDLDHGLGTHHRLLGQSSSEAASEDDRLHLPLTPLLALTHPITVPDQPSSIGARSGLSLQPTVDTDQTVDTLIEIE
ncbi:MAG: hypothetical protein VX992_07375, partial [Acidobacteriota bacterium]|nr:hypothetical protein [Acidobacteriota bacterium]